VKRPELTLKMQQALLEAKASGSVFAGNNVDRRGRMMRHAASTLRALASRGLLTLNIGPDGGTMGRLTKRGENSAVLLMSGNGYLESVGRRG
jgi:hypothetical protein